MECRRFCRITRTAKIDPMATNTRPYARGVGKSADAGIFQEPRCLPVAKNSNRIQRISSRPSPSVWMAASTPPPRVGYSSKVREVNDENDELMARRRELRGLAPGSVPPRTPPPRSVAKASPRTQDRHKQKLELLHRLQRQNSYFRRELGKAGASATCEGSLEASESVLRAQKLKASIEIWQQQSGPLSVEALDQRPLLEGEPEPTVDALRSEMADYAKQIAVLTLELEAMKKRCDEVERHSQASLERVQAEANETRRHLDQRNADYDDLLKSAEHGTGVLVWLVRLGLCYLLAWNICRGLPVGLERYAH